MNNKDIRVNKVLYRGFGFNWFFIEFNYNYFLFRFRLLFYVEVA